MRNSRLSSLRSWRAASAGLLAAALWALAGTASAAGIADTRHNLGTSGAIAGQNKVSDTAEICVFCHTPHGADTAAPAPLWNKRLGAAGVPAGGGTYTTYAQLQTPSLDGQVAQVGSISMACLSCHDGTQAMDNIINAPGSGGYQVDGGGTNGLGYTWSGTATAEGLMGASVANLGSQLRDDHPIGIQYCGGGVTGSGNVVTAACKDGDFIGTTGNQPTRLQTASVNGAQVFWVETGGVNSIKQRTDLPLYTRAFVAGSGPSVECGTCHDPHVSENQAGPNSQNAGATFLRISNASSAVCTSCHVK
jgi:hypothetical protein